VNGCEGQVSSEKFMRLPRVIYRDLWFVGRYLIFHVVLVVSAILVCMASNGKNS
jgi:cell division protein FtsL